MSADPLDPAHLPPGTVVDVHGTATRWTARITSQHDGPDPADRPAGTRRVEVLDPGTSFWRAGLLVDADTRTLRPTRGPWPSDCPCRWTYTGAGWSVPTPLAGCPHHPARPMTDA